MAALSATRSSGADRGQDAHSGIGVDALRQVERTELVAAAFEPRRDQRRIGATLRRGTQDGRVVFWGALAVALVPFVVSAVAVLVGARGYTSFGDNALTELTVRDVGRHAVEVGVWVQKGFR